MEQGENKILNAENAENDTQKESFLSDIEARVLGCLMEKQQTTPDQYPLTLNSLVLACNQTSSREPKMSLSEGDVGHCLRMLEKNELVRVHFGSRASRYEHSMTKIYLVDKPLQAVLTIMMLRGPQTLNELLTRTQRTSLFEGIDDIENALERLIERAKPLVKLIPRQEGQREDRYAQLLCGEPKIEATTTARATATSKAASSSELEARVTALETQLKQLQNELAALKGGE